MILSIDLGFVATGWAVFGPGPGPKPDSDAYLWSCGCIRTQSCDRKRGVRMADDDAERCAVLYRRLIGVRLQHIGKLRGIVAEIPTGGSQGARANRAMGLATGLFVGWLEYVNLPVEYVTPAAVKMAATGGRSASKDEMILRAMARWPALPAAWGQSQAIWGPCRDIPAWAAEHIADACWAFEAARNGTLVRTVFGRNEVQ